MVRRTPAGEHYTDKAPHFVIDFVLQVRPPHGEQIQLADIRALVYDFMKHGFSLIGFSCDQFQSADTIQAMKRRGVAAEILSVDTSMAPYEALRSAIYEKRIELYDHAPLMAELRALEHDRLRGKVDHPIAGGKDVSDAVAGCISGLLKKVSRAPLGVLKPEEGRGDVDDMSWVTGAPAPEKDIETPIMPFLFG